MKITIRQPKWTIVYAFLTLLFFPPASYLFSGTVSESLRVLACIISLLMFIVYSINNGIKKRVIYMLVYFIYIFFFTTFFNYNNANIRQAIKWMLVNISFICLAEVGLAKNSQTYLKGVLIGAGIPCIISTYTFFRYAPVHGIKNGLIMGVGGIVSRQAWYYFTHANATLFIVFPVLVLFYYYIIRYQKKWIWTAHVSTLIMLVSFVYTDSTTSAIVLFIFAFFILFFWNPSQKAFLRRFLGRVIGYFNNTKFILIFIAAVIIGIVFFHVTDYFSELLTFLGKRTDLTNRIPTWERAIGLLRNHPIHMLFGYGWEKEIVTVTKLGFNHCHNILLELLYRGGIVGLIFFLVFTVSYLKDIHPDLVGRLLGMAIFVYFLCTVMDFYLYRYEIYLVYTIAANAFNRDRNEIPYSIK